MEFVWVLRVLDKQLICNVNFCEWFSKKEEKLSLCHKDGTGVMQSRPHPARRVGPYKIGIRTRR